MIAKLLQNHQNYRNCLILLPNGNYRPSVSCDLYPTVLTSFNLYWVDEIYFRLVNFTMSKGTLMSASV